MVEKREKMLEKVRVRKSAELRVQMMVE